MSDRQLSLNEKCLARLPRVLINDSMTAEDARRDWTKPLLVIVLASARLSQDVEIFFERGPYANKGLSIQFLLAASHYTEILLRPVLQTIENGLYNYRNVMAEENFVKGKVPSLGDLLELAKQQVAELRKSWIDCMNKTCLDKQKCTAQLGQYVPTAAPRGILIQMLVNHPLIMKRLSNLGAENVLANIGQHLSMPDAPKIDLKEFEIVNVYADGSPKMYFVCHHVDAAGNLELHSGANQANWAGLPAIQEICRANRNTRLESYLHLANKAFAALRQMEKSIVLPQSMASQSEERKLSEIRSRAVAAMKNSPHPDFLGRTSELGQAFSNTMKSSQCCYVCQGMMGYKIAKVFEAREVEKYRLHFKWELRGDYAHSCAEIETSLQCAVKWQENWKSVKH